MRFQALMPDILHWLGIKKIDRMLSMSNMKHDAIVDSGIKILERIPIPDDMIPSDSRVEIDAKINAGYFTTGKQVTMDDLAKVRGRGWEKWEDIEVCESFRLLLFYECRLTSTVALREVSPALQIGAFLNISSTSPVVNPSFLVLSRATRVVGMLSIGSIHGNQICLSPFNYQLLRLQVHIQNWVEIPSVFPRFPCSRGLPSAPYPIKMLPIGRSPVRILFHTRLFTPLPSSILRSTSRKYLECVFQFWSSVSVTSESFTSRTSFHLAVKLIASKYIIDLQVLPSSTGWDPKRPKLTQFPVFPSRVYGVQQ